MKYTYYILIILFPLVLLQSIAAQDIPVRCLRDRIGLRTNTLDWVLLVPNATVEFDLSENPKSKWTLSLGGRYNWNTSSTYLPSMNYNISEGRLEARHYFRTSFRNNVNQMTSNESSSKQPFFRSFMTSLVDLGNRLVSTKRKNPKYWRVYYWGVFVDSYKYNFKLGRTGYQGDGIGLGVSGGWSQPLYTFNTGALDLEIGASLGVAYTTYKKYERDTENNIYVQTDKISNKIMPFAPLVSEIRIAFVYRFKSISKKYK